MITDFLGTKRTTPELASALRVIRDFKACESNKEWMQIPFMCWSKLEQLEEFLAHLVEGAELAEDTKEYMATNNQGEQS